MNQVMLARTSSRPASLPTALLMLLLLSFLLLARPAGAAQQMLADTDLSGDVYRSFELIAPVPDFCHKVCEKDEGCRAWTFSWPGKKGKRAKCFLKRSVTEKRKDTCCISGYKKRSIASRLGNAVRNWLGASKDTTPAPSTSGGTPADDTGASTQATRQPTPSLGEPTPAPQPRPEPARQPVPQSPAQAPTPQQDDAALAEKRDFCRRYARAAREANRTARRMGCGFRGGLWGASFNGYFNWCMKNTPQAAERNTARRASALRRCETELATRRQPGFGMPQFPPGAAFNERLRDLYERFRRSPREARQPRDPRWRQAPFVYSWLKRTGPGPRATPWQPTYSGKCPLVRACDCPQGDTCRVYEPGSIAVYWPLGCNAPPAYVICRVRRR